MPSARIKRGIRGIYIHVPFCDGKCHYCAFYSERYDRGAADRWLGALTREMQPWRGARPATIFIGGGTPSLLRTGQWQTLAQALHECFSIQPGAEWSVETNPASLTLGLLRGMRTAGVNRVSLGAQSFHDRELRRLGRRHAATDIARAVRDIRAAGFKNFNLDLLAGIPGASLHAWRDTLQAALDLAPPHISVYALTLEEGTRLTQLARRNAIRPAPDTRQLSALAVAENVLTGAGYIRYEISNYARPGFECRHNLDCWRGAKYLGFGPGAAAHYGMIRRQNSPDLQQYLAALEAGQTPPHDQEIISHATKKIEKLIFGLRMAEGVSATLPDASQSATLARLAADGLTQKRHGRWTLTQRGRELADHVAVELI